MSKILFEVIKLNVTDNYQKNVPILLPTLPYPLLLRKMLPCLVVDLANV